MGRDLQEARPEKTCAHTEVEGQRQEGAAELCSQQEGTSVSERSVGGRGGGAGLLGGRGEAQCASQVWTCRTSQVTER